MAKKLDPQEIEQSRRKKTRADNREERKERIHDGIRKNRESGGVIIITSPRRKNKNPATPSRTSARADSPKNACCSLCPCQHTGRTASRQF